MRGRGPVTVRSLPQDAPPLVRLHCRDEAKRGSEKAGGGPSATGGAGRGSSVLSRASDHSAATTSGRRSVRSRALAGSEGVRVQIPASGSAGASDPRPARR